MGAVFSVGAAPVRLVVVRIRRVRAVLIVRLTPVAAVLAVGVVVVIRVGPVVVSRALILVVTLAIDTIVGAAILVARTYGDRDPGTVAPAAVVDIETDLSLSRIGQQDKGGQDCEYCNNSAHKIRLRSKYSRTGVSVCERKVN